MFLQHNTKFPIASYHIFYIKSKLYFILLGNLAHQRSYFLLHHLKQAILKIKYYHRTAKLI